MPRRPRTHLTYRPALDGLRGIAVLAVFVFHLWPSLLPGGWLGVDLFFVLSGFLITSLLVRQFSRTGHIDLRAFWMARMRRLLPSLLVVLVAVSVMSALWTVPVRREGVGLDILTTLGYVANWRLLLSNEAYFADTGTPSPLRHAWSLGIEEQYYILFPLLFLLLTRWFHRRKHLALAFLGLALASALWMAHLYIPDVDPTRVYYGTDTRAFELLIGAAAGAWVGPRQWGRRRPARWMRGVELSAWPAILLMVLAFVLVHEDTPVLFRGGLVLFCVVVLVLILTAASPHRTSFQSALSWEPLRQLGLISYALYLWHWPLHTFLTSDHLPIPDTVAPLVQAVIALAAAAATYRFVERPIREHGVSGLFRYRPAAGPLLAAGSVVAVVAAGFVLPHTRPLVANTAETGASGGQLHYHAQEYRPAPTRHDVVLLGNSIPASLMRVFPAGKYPDLRVSEATSFGCTPYDATGELEDNQPTKLLPQCITFQRDWVNALKGQQSLVYFVPQNLLHDQRKDGKVLREGTPAHDAWVQSTFDLVKGNADHEGVKNVAFVTFACHRMPTFGKENGGAAVVNTDSKVRHLNSTIRAWSKAHNVRVIDQYQFLCPGNRYFGRINDTDLYADALHFTETSGPIMWSWMAPQLQQMATQ